MAENLSPQDWYSPMEAVEIVQRHHGALAKTLIADKLLDGAVRARAQRKWESTHKDLRAAWRDRNNAEDVEIDVDIDRYDWKSSQNWISDVGMWRWTDNRFVITQCLDPADRTILTGLRFLGKDIHNIAKPNRNPGGKKRNFRGWALLFRELLHISRESGLTFERFPTKASLSLHCTTIFQEREDLAMLNSLDDDTIEDACDAVWDEVILPLKPAATPNR